MLEEEVSWHSEARFQVAENIARDLLTGVDAEANEEILFRRGQEWNEFRLNLLMVVA